MKAYDRSIKIAVDKLTGELLNADEVFKNRPEGFEYRKEFARDKLDPHCLECDQRLIISTSLYDRIHFRHEPNSGDCLLKNPEISPGEIQLICDVLKAKESPRHKFLKNKIGNSLKEVEGIDSKSISIDSNFIVRGPEKRRPDVYCRYEEKEVVFEIQLSDLSLRYILSRYDFYKEHGIYLIWILDNFNIHGQSQMERDLKYLSDHQNFFKLDEENDQFKLICDYKVPYLTSELDVHSKWQSNSVSLGDLTFDPSLYQAFFNDFARAKQTAEQESYRRREEQRRAETEARQRAAEESALRRVNSIVFEIRRIKTNHVQVYTAVTALIDELTGNEKTVLNSLLKLNELGSTGKTKLNQLIAKATPDDYGFFDFLLKCEAIDLDVNLTDTDGTTSFQEVRRNQNTHRNSITRELFRRGYKLTDSDIAFMTKAATSNGKLLREMQVFKFLDQLKDRNLVDGIIEHDSLVLTIESAKRGEIVGFNYRPDEWVALANNAIEHYPKYWEYIESAFKYYGIWNKIVSSDRKGTFRKKLQQFYQDMPDQAFDFDDILRDLYPEFQSDQSGSITSTLSQGPTP
jgi:competence CoiA-like predicted nuclease